MLYLTPEYEMPANYVFTFLGGIENLKPSYLSWHLKKIQISNPAVDAQWRHHYLDMLCEK